MAKYLSGQLVPKTNEFRSMQKHLNLPEWDHSPEDAMQIELKILIHLPAN